MAGRALLLLVLVPPLTLAVDPGDPAKLAVPADVQKKAEQYVRDCDDEDIFVRDRATAALRDLGRLGYPALAAASARGPSKLAKPRVDMLLAEAVPLEFEARAEVFLEDKKGKHKHDMLGWNELVKAAGDTPESRKLFAAVLESDICRELLLEAAKPHTPADDEAAKKNRHRLTLVMRKETLRWPRAGLLLSDADRNPVLAPEVPVTFFVGAMLAELIYAKWYYSDGLLGIGKLLLQTDDGREAVGGKGKYGTAFNKLMDAWADTRSDRDLHCAAALYAYSKARPERYSACMVRLVDESRKKEWTAGRFFSELAEIGDAACLACLKRCLDSKAVVCKRDGYYIEDRDLALGYLAELTGQSPGEYGLGKGTPNDKYAFVTDSQRTADEKRSAGLAKWAEWEKANPDGLKAKAKKPETKDK